tara:strand:- start:18 stop:227 length:210 start_codon:yes stop_codon:yes gene_type:complete
MNKYIVMGKISSDFNSAMLTRPQNKQSVIRPFVNVLGAELNSMLWLNHLDMQVCLHLTLPNDEALERNV